MSTLPKKLHQRTEIERLREALRKAESQIEFAKGLREENRDLRKRYVAAMERATRYDDLREMDILIMDSEEGVKNLSGEALDNYIDRKSESAIKVLSQETFGTYARSLATSMTETKELLISKIMQEEIRKMANDTRSKS